MSILLFCCSSLYAGVQTGNKVEMPDSIQNLVRLKSYLLINPDELGEVQLDSLLQKQVPLAFLSSGSTTGKLQRVLPRISKQNLPVVILQQGEPSASNNSNPGTLTLGKDELDKISTSEAVEAVQQKLGSKNFLWLVVDSDSLPSVDYFVRFWGQTGKLPNFIQVKTSKIADAAAIVTALNARPKIFGVVRNGDRLLADVSWKDLPNRKTNGYFCFPNTYPALAYAPYKAGYQFSPDIILPSPENLHNLKIFNAVPLHPDFGLTDCYTFQKDVRNVQRKNDSEIIRYGIDFVNDEVRGNCAFFSGKAYLDGGLMSRSALKPNFSITAWVKPTELENNNCILGKGKNFVLKIHQGLLTFTVQGVKDYFSTKTPIPINQWSFVGLVHTKADNHISFYLNGELTEKINLLLPYVESDYTVLIGSNLWEEYFAGYMQEIKIWDRELNEDEIRNEFLSGRDAKQAISSGWFILVLLPIGVFAYIFRRHLFKRTSEKAPQKSDSLSVPVQRAVPVSDFPENQEQINCFGGLKVINSEGKDISLKFSPKIKQLFVLIFLHSVADGKGISSKKLSDCLWPGMSPQNAKNIRGTNIQNLKALLSSCNGIKLLFQDKLWVLEFSDGYFADYDFVENKLDELKSVADVEILAHDLPGLLSVLRKGTIFPNMSESWIDPYIDRMSNRVIEFGLKLFRELPEGKYDSLLLDIAEVISINDPLNEPALRKKIGILTRQGKLSLAHSVFDNFTKLYFELYQEKYPADFKAMFSGEMPE